MKTQEWTPEQVEAILDRASSACTQRDAARKALQALYNACPTGFGNDRALDEALKQAEAVLGVRRGA
jgi:hypothetical protein